MKLYRVDWQDRDHGRCVIWAGSLRQARKERAAIDRDKMEGVPTITPVTIPTRRHDFIDWLNRHLSTDNG